MGNLPSNVELVDFVHKFYLNNMASDDYRVQNIYKYARKTYKNSRRGTHDSDVNNLQFDTHVETNISPRSDEIVDAPSCTCDLEPEVEIASIPHMKCPVITLAQQQLQRLLDETDQLLYDNARCCSSLWDFLWLCKELLATHNKYYCIAILLISAAFFIGLILGAASCGSYLGQFNSPILTCFDKLFIFDSYRKTENTYSIV